MQALGKSRIHSRGTPAVCGACSSWRTQPSSSPAPLTKQSFSGSPNKVIDTNLLLWLLSRLESSGVKVNIGGCPRKAEDFDREGLTSPGGLWNLIFTKMTKCASILCEEQADSMRTLKEPFIIVSIFEQENEVGPERKAATHLWAFSCIISGTVTPTYVYLARVPAIAMTLLTTGFCYCYL